MEEQQIQLILNHRVAQQEAHPSKVDEFLQENREYLRKEDDEVDSENPDDYDDEEEDDNSSHDDGASNTSSSLSSIKEDNTYQEINRIVNRAKQQTEELK